MNREQMEQFLTTAIAGFESDPADTDYQRGYLDALIEMLHMLRDE